MTAKGRTTSVVSPEILQFPRSFDCPASEPRISLAGTLGEICPGTLAHPATNCRNMYAPPHMSSLSLISELNLAPRWPSSTNRHRVMLA